MEDKLLPCPVCGSDGKLVNGAPEIFVTCSNSFCNPGRNLAETAITDWNQRVLSINLLEGLGEAIKIYDNQITVRPGDAKWLNPIVAAAKLLQQIVEGEN